TPSRGSNVVFLTRSEGLIDKLSGLVDRRMRLNATTDPAIAAAFARREAPDLVLLDACAPGFAAWRALTALQPDGVLAGTRVVLIAQDTQELSAAVLGEFSVLTKPIY